MRSNSTARMYLVLFCAVNLLLGSLFSTVTFGVQPEILGVDEPAPSTVEDLETPMSKGLKEKEEKPSLFPGWK